MKSRHQRRSILRNALKTMFFLSMPMPGFSQTAEKDFPIPQGKVILSITGNIKNKNLTDEAAFDLSMIEKLGTVTFETMTPWYSEKVKFEGVSMSNILRYVGAMGNSIVVTALNDYTTEIPISDFSSHQVILATKRDGVYMPIKDKGPLFIVYNYDSDPSLKHQRYYSRSAWQVAKIRVK